MSEDVDAEVSPGAQAIADPDDLLLTDEEFEDLESAEGTVSPVSYSRQDFDGDGLVRRLNKKDVVIASFAIVETSLTRTAAHPRPAAAPQSSRARPRTPPRRAR